MIIYLSCTGNTRWAAQKTARALGDRLINIADFITTNDNGTKIISLTLNEGESIGFFFPIHGWRPPVMVRDFISRLHINNAAEHYCYVVCTAGDTVGEAFRIFENDAKNVGLIISSAISLLMPESYIGLPFMNTDTIDNEKRKKQDANNRLSKFIEEIKNHKQGIRRIDIGRWPRTNSRFLGSIFVKMLITDKHFHVDTERCILCGLCSRVCPTKDIKADKGMPPRWLHNDKCLTCFACYHHCPTKAISFGKFTKTKGQYYFEKNELE